MRVVQTIRSEYGFTLRVTIRTAWFRIEHQEVLTYWGMTRVLQHIVPTWLGLIQVIVSDPIVPPHTWPPRYMQYVLLRRIFDSRDMVIRTGFKNVLENVWSVHIFCRSFGDVLHATWRWILDVIRYISAMRVGLIHYSKNSSAICRQKQYVQDRFAQYALWGIVDVPFSYQYNFPHLVRQDNTIQISMRIEIYV